MPVRLPDFLIVGVPKAGTTTLHENLRQHPEVYLPEEKELHYFTYPLLAKATAGPGDRRVLASLCGTLDEYSARFTNVAESLAVGDCSPSYFFFSGCIPRIKQTLGDAVRSIIVLRDPTSRAYSNWQQLVNSGREVLAFREALDAESDRQRRGWGDFWRYRQHSLYADRLATFLDAFAREQLKVIIFEEMIANPSGTLQDVYRFLGVNDRFTPRRVETVYNQGGQPRIATLERLLNSVGSTAVAIKDVVPDGVYRSLRRLKRGLAAGNRARGEARLDPSLRAELMGFFEADIRRTERFLGRSLDLWRDTGHDAAIPAEVVTESGPCSNAPDVENQTR